MRNEGPFLLDWLAHHKALGINDFLVFSNDCDDGTDRLLDILQAAGEVHHIPQTATGKSVQWQALRASRDHPVYARTDWAMALDCDEYLSLAAPLSGVQQLIAACPGADAIALSWRLFGHSGRLRFAEGSTPEHFVQAAPEDILFPAAARFFKSLFRVRNGPFQRPGIHRPKTRNSKTAIWVDGAGARCDADFCADDSRIVQWRVPSPNALAEVNHYSLRSIEDFIAKRRRGLPNRSAKALDASYWAERNFNTVRCDRIAAHAPARRDELARLTALPGVAQAHADCVAAHRAIIAQALSDPQEATLFSRLALLSGSQPPDSATATELLKLVHGARKTPL